MRALWPRVLVIMSLTMVAAAPAAAQVLKFLSEEEYRYLVGEISGDAAYEHLRFYTQFHKPRAGAEGLMEVARYTERKAREYGLSDVRLIRQPSQTVPWNARHAELWLVEPEVERLAGTVQTQLHLADNSRPADVTAELVEVGAGSSDKDYEGKEVKGKVVLGWGPLGAVHDHAVWRRGALGVIVYQDPHSPQGLNYPHQVRWLTLPLQGEGGKPSAFAFGLSAQQGAALRRRLLDGKKPFKVRARVDSEVGSDKWQVMVEGFIRGTSIQDQDVVLTAHLQEEKFSANDDGSGCGNVLEIARALVKLIDEGRLRRPRRNLRFWWVTEISSERQYFADHPEEHRKMLAAINQDMVGANQGQDLLRVQHVTRLPFARAHFLNDIAEAVVEFVVQSNSSHLAAGQAGTPQPYPKPILARLGTRHRYNAQMVPFFNNTDHMTFNEAPIGVPAITFTNWPDNYIHTSDDDLWNIDRTQLQRNAFAVAAIAYIIAAAGGPEAERVAAHVYARAVARLGEAYQVATEVVAAGRDGDRAEAFKQAASQIHQAALRERRAIESVARLAPDRPALLRTLVDNLLQVERAHSQGLSRFFHALTGQGDEPVVSYTVKEKELQAMRPELAAGPREFLERRGKVKGVSGLHNLMAFEVLNFVDGRRTGVQIYEAVSAEARQGGEHIYGRVTPEMVLEYLKNLADAGLIKISQDAGRSTGR